MKECATPGHTSHSPRYKQWWIAHVPC